MLTDAVAGKCLILTEAMSRYGNDAAMLVLSQIVDDGLCRVITFMQMYAQKDYSIKFTQRGKPLIHLQVEDFVELLRHAPYMNTPKILLRTAVDLLDNPGQVWCVGEMNSTKAQALHRLYNGQISIMPTDSQTSLCVFQIPSSDINSDSVWPDFQGDYGPRLLILPLSDTHLGAMLSNLQYLVNISSLEGLNLWRQFHSTCLTRKGIHALCQEAVLCILPDGPHFRQAAFHSLAFSSNTIVDALCKILKTFNYDCTITENSNDEYTLLSTVQ